MKSVIKKQPLNSVIPYPKLMVSTETKTIVLFTHSKNGTVVFEPYHYWGLGHINTTWDMDVFIDFEGEITLSND